MSLGKTIIVIDDDEDDHFLLTRIFEKIGVSTSVKFFSQGNVALDYLRNMVENPFLILCDMNMPLMTGIEFRKRMLLDESLSKKNTPFIFFSTVAMASKLKEAYELRVQGFFIKDQTLERMEKTLKAILDYWERCEFPSEMIPVNISAAPRTRERPE